MVIGCGNTSNNKGLVDIHPAADGVNDFKHKIAAGESTTILPTLMENYKTLGVEQYPGHTVKAITMDTLVCEDKEGGEVLIPCDYVVMAVGARPAAFDASALENAGIPVVRVGDCADKVADISNAIKTAYDAACAL